MESLASQGSVTHFKAPKKCLGDLDAEVAATLIAAAADIALIIDGEGVIRDVALGNAELSREACRSWSGQPWVDTVTVESRDKVQELLSDAAANAPPRWRQVNHPSPMGQDLPVRYSAIQAGSRGSIVAVGRELRAVAMLQQRLVEAQQAMERDYARQRNAETRYRLLFQLASEAVVIADAATLKVVEANPASARLLASPAKQLVGSAFQDLFGVDARQAVQGHLAAVRSTGRADELRAGLSDGEREVLVAASLFRQESSSYFLIRLTPPAVEAQPLPKEESRLLNVVKDLPDGFVVTDTDQRILTANGAFLDLAQLAAEEQVRGKPLDRWLGRSGVDLNVLIANLKQHGFVRRFATVVRGEYGSAEEVEISAVSVPEGEQPCLGFTIRNVTRRLTAVSRGGRELPHSIEQLTELVGRVSLKELVRETTEMIEQMCIEAALELTGDNRASAAEMLGLSRQSLYSKLHRYGLGDLASEGKA